MQQLDYALCSVWYVGILFPSALLFVWQKWKKNLNKLKSNVMQLKRQTKVNINVIFVFWMLLLK